MPRTAITRAIDGRLELWRRAIHSACSAPSSPTGSPPSVSSRISGPHGALARSIAAVWNSSPSIRRISSASGGRLIRRSWAMYSRPLSSRSRSALRHRSSGVSRNGSSVSCHHETPPACPPAAAASSHSLGGAGQIAQFTHTAARRRRRLARGCRGRSELRVAGSPVAAGASSRSRRTRRDRPRRAGSCPGADPRARIRGPVAVP